MITATTDDPLREITLLFEEMKAMGDEADVLELRLKNIDLQLEFYKELKNQMLFQRRQETVEPQKNDPYAFLQNIGKIAQLFPEKQVPIDTGPLDIYRQRVSEKSQSFKTVTVDGERTPEELKRLEKLDHQKVVAVMDRALRNLEAAERKRQGKPDKMDLYTLRLEAEKEKTKTIDNIIDAQKINPLDKHKIRMAKAKLLGL